MAATTYPKNLGVNVADTGAKLVKKGEANTDVSVYQDILQSYMGGIDQGVAEKIAGSAKKTDFNSAVNDPYIQEIERRAAEERQRQAAAQAAAAAAATQQNKAESYQQYQAKKGKFRQEAFGEAEAYDFGDINRERQRIQQSNYLEDPSNFLLTEADLAKTNAPLNVGQPYTPKGAKFGNSTVQEDTNKWANQREEFGDTGGTDIKSTPEPVYTEPVEPVKTVSPGRARENADIARNNYEQSYKTEYDIEDRLLTAEAKLNLALRQYQNGNINAYQIYLDYLNEYNQLLGEYNAAVDKRIQNTAAYSKAIDVKNASEQAYYLTASYGRDLQKQLDTLEKEYYDTHPQEQTHFSETSGYGIDIKYLADDELGRQIKDLRDQYETWELARNRYLDTQESQKNAELQELSRQSLAAALARTDSIEDIDARIKSLDNERAALRSKVSDYVTGIISMSDADYNNALARIEQIDNLLNLARADRAFVLNSLSQINEPQRVAEAQMKVETLEAEIKRLEWMDRYLIAQMGVSSLSEKLELTGDRNRVFQEKAAKEKELNEYKAFLYSYDMNLALDSLPEEDRLLFDAVAKGGSTAKSAEAALKAKYGDKYEQYLDYAERDYNAMMMRRTQAEISKEIKENGWNKITYSALSVATNLLSSPGALYEIIRQTATKEAYEPYDVNASGFQMQNLTKTIRSSVSEDMGAAGSFFYQTAMSGIDSMVAMYVFKPVAEAANLISAGAGADIISHLPGVTLGVTAATNTMQEIAERGGTGEQVLFGGIMAGIFECLFESVSISQIGKMQEKEAIRGVKDILRNFGKSMLTNFEEEAATELANIVVDTVAMGTLSSAAQRMQELADQGYTDSEAKKIIAKELTMQIFEAGISGAVMGAGFTVISIPKGIKVGEAVAQAYANYVDTARVLPESMRPAQPDLNTLDVDGVQDYGRKVYDALGDYLASSEGKELVSQMQKTLEALGLVTSKTVTTASDLARAIEGGKTTAQQDISRIETAEITEEDRPREEMARETGAESDSEAEEYTDTAEGKTNAPAAEQTEESTSAINTQRETAQNQEATAEEINAPAAAETERAVSTAAERRSEYWTRVAADIISQIDNQYSTEAERRAAIETEISEIEAGGEVQLARAMRAIANESDIGYNQVKGEIDNGEAGDLRSDGSSERNAGRRASEQTGSVAEGTGRDQEGEAGKRQRIRAQRLSQVSEGKSTAEIVGQGIKTDKIYVHNPDSSDTELNEITETANRNGYQVTFVRGDMHFQREDGSTFSAKGVRTEDGHIFVNVTHGKYSATEIFEHELFHNLVKDNPGLLEAAKQHLLDNYTEEQINKMLDRYKSAYDGTGATLDDLYEEILGNIYADMMKSPIREAVRKEAAERSGVREKAKASIDVSEESTQAARETEDGLLTQRGETPKPPDIRYSIDDERIKALEKEIEELEISADNESVYPRIQALRLQLDALKPEAKGPTYNPHTTMQQIGTRLIDLFKIPAGQKAKTRSQINDILSRLYTQGYVANSDVESLLRVMYERGEVTQAAEEIYEGIRDQLKGTKLYVSPEVKAEFGDNWGAFRRSLFAAGISTTNNKSDIGIDQKYMELADMYPGLFSSEETDMSNMLRELRSAADMGKAQTLTLAQAAENEGISSEEEFDALYKIAQNMLQIFADEAELEVKYREEKDDVKKEAQRKAYERYLERRKNDIDSRERSELNRKTLNLIKRIKPLARYNAETYEAAVSEQSEHVQKLIRNAVQNIDTVATKLTGKKQSALENLRDAIKEQKEKDPNFILSDRTKAAVERVYQIQVNNMNVDDLLDLYNALTAVIHEIQTYKKTAGELEDRYFEDLAMSTADELKYGRGMKTSGALRNFLDEGQLSPERALLRYVGYDRNTAWGSLVEALVQGDIDAAEYELGARLIFADFINKNQKWLKTAAGKNADLIEIEIPSVLGWDHQDKPIFGENIKVKVTKMMLVQMALDLTNDDNMRHVKWGGYTFPDMDLYKKGKMADAIKKGTRESTIKLAPATIKSIVDQYLDKTGKEYVKLLQKYYDDYSKPRINDRSQKLEGVDRAITNHYGPIRTNQNYTNDDIFTFDMNISNTGSLKERIKGTVPVLLLDADETMAWHRSKMAMYYGYAIPVRNMNMLLQHKIDGEKTVSAALDETAEKYVNDLLREIQNGSRADKWKNSAEGMLRRITGNYIKNVLLSNLSSTLKQLSAFGLASAEIGPQYIAKGMVSKKTSRDIINKYTPFLEYRNGYEWLGDVSDFVRNVNGAQTPTMMKYLLGLNWLQKVDIWGNRRLWDAAVKYVSDTIGLRPGTKAEIESGNDPFYKAVAKEFNRVTQLTQTNTNFMSKPKILQAEGLLGQAFTMFRTDAMQAAGIIRENLGNMVTQYKKGNKQLAARATKKAVQSVIGVLSAFMWEPIAKMIRDILVRKDDDYKEDDKLSFDKMFENEVKGVIYNIAGLTIFGEQLLDFVYSQVKGETYYEPDIPSVSMIGDSLKKAWKAATDIGEWILSANDKKLNKGDYWASNGDKIMKDLRNLAYTISQLLGIPAKNLETNIVGILGQAFPQLKAAYDDLFKEYKKSDIKSLEGEAKNVAINSYLTDTLGKLSPEIKEMYAELYRRFGESVLPGSIENLEFDDRAATTSEQVQYESLYRSTMIDALNALTESEYFNSLSKEEQTDVLKALNTYASDQAKKAIIGKPIAEKDKKWEDKLADIIGKDLSVDMGVIYYALQKTIKNDIADEIASLAKLDALFAGETFDGKENTVKNSAIRKRLELLDEMPISDTAKGLLYQAFMSDNEGMEALAKELTGAEFYKAAKAVEGDYNKAEKLERLAEADLSNEAVALALNAALDESQTRDTIVGLIQSGKLSGYDAVTIMKDMDDSDSSKRTAIANADISDRSKWETMSYFLGDAQNAQASFDAIRASGATPEQYAQLKNNEMESKYLSLINDNISPDSAVRILDAVKDMPDLPEGESYKVSEKQRAAVDACANGEEQVAAFMAFASGDAATKAKTSAKLTGALGYDVDVKMYLDFKDTVLRDYNFESPDKEGISQKEAKAALDASNYTKQQKAVLYQLMSMSWKANKNPYDKEAAAAIHAAYDGAK